MPTRMPRGNNLAKSPLDRMYLLQLQIRDLIDLRNFRGFYSFFGFGEAQPFNVPVDRCELTCRTQSNLMYYSSNYFMITMLLGFEHALMNPMFMIVLTIIAAGWAYCNYLTANESSSNPVIILGGPTTASQRDTCMMLGSIILVIVFGGPLLLYIVIVSLFLIILHAIMRNQALATYEELEDRYHELSSSYEDDHGHRHLVTHDDEHHI
ncbi:hypothetical protein ACHHYP_02198 [Achlya hypogyna]|uniref:PRA1 family protein n=1 Tax=Achlya hypogyna TaxID=1202772 RepID=A0A1V9Z781_ACHHY|nr:hypothetical protein ACHHYP_02198 [Achlya hypogyna]